MDTTQTIDSNTVSRSTMIGGIITGQIAGLIMAVAVILVFMVFLGKGPLYPVQVIGSLAFGDKALEGVNLAAVLAGLIFHQLGPSLLWGVLFGFLATKINVKDEKSALILGLGVGVFSMVGPYLLIPFLMNTFQGHDIWNREVPIFWDWAAHLIFGASFVLYPKITKLFNA